MTFDDFIDEWRGSAPYITARTSGSTGTAKEIRLSKEFVRRSALRTNRFFSIDSGSRLHSCVSPDFIGGKMMAVRSDLAGCRLTYETPSNRPLLNAGQDGEITLLSVVPSQMLGLLDYAATLPVIRHFLIGGSSISPELRSKICDAGVDAWESYGMTETASHIALRRVELEEGWFEAFDDISLRLDERGCLCIGFPEGEEIITNDLAILKDERHFRVVGRADMVIITGGKKVNPVEVEGKIASLFRSEIMITGKPDAKWGERIVLKVEGCYTDEEKRDIAAALQQRLAPWEKPKEVVWEVVLPRTENGKIKRK